MQGQTDAVLVPRPEDITEISHWKTTVKTNKWKKQKFNLDSQLNWKLWRFHKNKPKNTRKELKQFYLTALVILMNKHFNPTNTCLNPDVSNQTFVQWPFSDTGITWLWLLTWLLLMFWPQKCWYSSAWSMLGAATGQKQELHIWQSHRWGDKNCCSCNSAEATLGPFLVWQTLQK